MLKIGISACFLYPDISRTVFGPKTLTYIESDMFTYISRKGVLPVLIPNLKEDLMHGILEEMDGFIFQGGSDVHPGTYGEKPILNGRWNGDPYRDVYELKVMDFAFKNQKPVLAICRGLQLMNVYFGGTLYQDIPTQLPEAMIHRDAGQYDTLCHEVELMDKCILKDLYQTSTGWVNSVHHQAIKTLGNDLEVLAISKSDQIIEAIGYTGSEPGKVMAVQWHPEFSQEKTDRELDPEIIIENFLKHVQSS